MNMRKFVTALSVLLCLVLWMPMGAMASEPQYKFELTVDGKDSLDVETGDIVTLMVRIHRTDEELFGELYGTQCEIRYNKEFLRLVNDSLMLREGVIATDIDVGGDHRELYFNFLSLVGGAPWENHAILGTAQFEVVGSTGISKLRNLDYLVSLPDGSGSYPCVSNDVSLRMTDTCTVRFESNGGSEVETQFVSVGKRVNKPNDPVRAGYHLTGWYSDFERMHLWSFDTDCVEENMTLYAAWAEGEPTPEKGGTAIGCFPWWILLLIAAVYMALRYYRRKQEKQ